MRPCPSCHVAMEVVTHGETEVDLCAKCGGLFLEPGEGAARGIPVDALFDVATHAIRDDGLSLRPCPVHGTPMRRLFVASAAGGVDIERADCCGGVFLDAGEGTALAAAVRSIATRPRGLTHEEVVARGFQPPPDLRPTPTLTFQTLVRDAAAAAQVPFEHPIDDSRRRCPRCGTAFQQTRDGALEIDVCPGCGGLFLDAGEADARGLDLRGVFGDGPEAAVPRGVSELRCPVHGEAMTKIGVKWIGGEIQIERADACCRGLFFDDGEWEAFVRAARVALSHYSERVYAEQGEFATDAAIRRAQAEMVRAQGGDLLTRHVDRAMQHMTYWQMVNELRQRRSYE